MKMKLVLVEANDTVRMRLEEILSFYNIFDIVEVFTGINEAYEYICTNRVDVVFVNLAVGNAEFSGDGAYLSYNLSQEKPDILIVAYSEENLDADSVFGYCCDEYFRLPFDYQVIQRVVKRLQYSYELLQYKRASVNRAIMIKTKTGYQLVEVDKILFIERVSRKNRMVTVEGKEIILSGYSLDELEHILEEHNFYRCYQSFIVNLSKVSYIKANNETKNFSLVFDDYAGEVMLSRDKYAEVVQLLKSKYAKITL